MTERLTLAEVSAEVINANFADIEDAMNAKAELNGDSTERFNVADAVELTEAVNKSQLNTAVSSIETDISALEAELATKASLNGNTNETFSVADATESSQAINKGQLDSAITTISNTISELEEEIACISPSVRFCMNSGNVTNGSADLISYSGMVVSTKTDGIYANAVGTNASGEQIKLDSSVSLDMTGNADGFYNVFLKSDGTLEAFATTLYRQAATPSTPVVNDIWLDTSVEPLTAKKYSGSTWVDYTGIPIGKVTIVYGAITAINTNPYNQNGYNVNFQTQGYRFPDYARAVSKNWNNTYTANCDGYIYVRANCGGALSFVYLTINSVSYVVHGDGSEGSEGAIVMPVSKGDTYIASGGNYLPNCTIKFIPAIGAN